MLNEVAVNHFHVWTEENQENLTSRQPACGPRVKPRTARTRTRSYVCPFYRAPEHAMCQRMQVSYARKLPFSGTKWKGQLYHTNATSTMLAISKCF